MSSFAITKEEIDVITNMVVFLRPDCIKQISTPEIIGCDGCGGRCEASCNGDCYGGCKEFCTSCESGCDSSSF